MGNSVGLMPAGDVLFLHLTMGSDIFRHDDFPVLCACLTHELYGLLYNIVHYACELFTNSFKIYCSFLTFCLDNY